MPELLLEVGCEELPATFVEKAFNDLREKLLQLLTEAKLTGEHTISTAMGTPRRLIVSIYGLDERQADETKELRGPALKAAFDDSGNPTPALLGFCKSNGVDPATVRKDDKYVWVDKVVAGRPTGEVLQEILPQAIKSLTFEKTMRWGAARMRFARPIRWILAVFHRELVPFTVENVQSTLTSTGHRFYSPDLFEARCFDDLLAELRGRHVEPDPEIRRQQILDGAKQAASGEPQLTDALVDENVFLTEWPTPIEGEFKPEFLELPTSVLVTAMAKHEKMFPVKDTGGKLTNRFVFVRNSGEDETVRQGSQWVLNARFNDARFFYSEDVKHTMDEFLEKTSTIVFQEKLGNVRQRAERLSKLAEEIAVATGGDKDEQVLARNAGLYCKADLSTGLVSELPSLQGVIGSEYARREGMLEEVCWAIQSHYDLSKNLALKTPAERTGARVAMADQLDKLTGYLGYHLTPTGSSDPFGLRRAVTILIEAAWAWPTSIPDYYDLVAKAYNLYLEQGVQLDLLEAQMELQEICKSRYGAMLPHIRHDILDAALQHYDASKPRAVRLRVKCLEHFAKDIPFVQAATRPINIVAHAEKKEVEFAREDPLSKIDPDKLQSETGFALLQALKIRQEELDKAVAEERAEDVMSLLRALEKPINEFFDATMIMAEEDEPRFARLSLANACSLQLLAAGDFSKLVIEGARTEEP